MDIIVTKFNETFLKIDTERSVLAELNDYFTFMAPNYQFDKRFTKKLWDGKIRIFNVNKRFLYKGLYDNLLEFAKIYGHHIISDYSQSDNPVTREEAVSLFKKHGGPFEPHSYQIDALYHALKLQNTILMSATSSGKSYTIYNLCRTIQIIGRGLIIVPTINLVEQMKKDFIKYSETNGWNVDEMVQVIYEGQTKVITKPITISTWQSIYDMNPKWFEQFRYVIGDECHQYKASSLIKIMENLVNAKYRIGTTGSLDDWQINQLQLKGLFGSIKQIVTAKEMIDMGKAPLLNVNILLLKHPNTKGVLNMDFHQQTEWFSTHEKRNKFIRKVVMGEKGNKLVLFNLIEKHGIPLYKDFKKEYPNKEIYYISGMTPLNEREEIRKRFEEINDAVLVASYGTYSTGMNVPSIRHVFSTSPGKSKIRILQSIGRALRMHDGKNDVKFWDFADKMTDGMKYNIGFNHLEERMKIYYNEKHKVKLLEIDL